MKIKKIALILLLIFFLALALRFFAAAKVDVSTDEMIYSLLPLNIISAGRLGTVEQSPLYFYLADVGYSLVGGLSPIAARLPSILFGSLAVFLVYLLSVELFRNEKAGLISAFLFALSGYALEYNIEMDMTAFFFVLLSLLFFLKALKEEKARHYYLAAASFGLAVMVKNIVALFVPAYLLAYYLSKGKEKALSRESFKMVLISSLIFLMVLLPVFSYNYLVYNHADSGKKITDYYFSTILGIGETVHGGLQGKSWEFSRLVSVMQEKITLMLRWETVLLLFGAVGTILCFRKSEWKEKKMGIVLLWVALLFLVGYIGGQTGSSSHFLWMPLVFSIFAGYGLVYVHEKIVQKFSFKYAVHVFIAAAVIINLVYLQGVTERNKSASAIPLWSFVHEKIPENAIVIMDPRIYSGNSAWVLNDRHYLEGRHLSQLMEAIKNSPEAKIPIPLYYIECGTGSYCGWKEEDFKRIESTGKGISDFLVPGMEQVAELKAAHHFVVYTGTVDAPFSIYDAIDSTHIFWFYPVGWKGDTFIDNYTPKGLGVLMNMLGFLLLYVDLLLALLAIPASFYLILKPEFSSP
ncbi:MAG: glycosyltransferase family 39 protein [Nanoarchaeota archaeon]|nr:glycosyltransferase family 39 protein [Nanoarchaeota archaeon]